MSDLLQRGQVLRTKHSGQTCTVEQFLGGGGQGDRLQATGDRRFERSRSRFGEAVARCAVVFVGADRVGSDSGGGG